MKRACRSHGLQQLLSFLPVSALLFLVVSLTVKQVGRVNISIMPGLWLPPWINHEPSTQYVRWKTGCVLLVAIKAGIFPVRRTHLVVLTAIRASGRWLRKRQVLLSVDILLQLHMLSVSLHNPLILPIYLIFKFCWACSAISRFFYSSQWWCYPNLPCKWTRKCKLAIYKVVSSVWKHVQNYLQLVCNLGQMARYVATRLPEYGKGYWQ